MPTTLPPGHWGKITLTESKTGWKARTKVRDLDGRVREVTRTAATKGRAEQAVKKALLDRTTPPIVPGDTVAKMTELWLASLARDTTLAPQTRRQYESVVNNHLLGTELAKRPINMVTSLEIEERLLAVPGGSSRRATRQRLRDVFDLAHRMGVLSENPMTSLRPQKASRSPVTPGPRDTHRALTREQRDGLLAFVEGHDVAKRLDLVDLVHFMARTGVRIGEVCALQWTDLDLKVGTAHIHGTVVRRTGGLWIQPITKSAAGMRTLILPGVLVTRLKARAALQGHGKVLVFPNTSGQIRDLSKTTRDLRRVFDAAGLSWMTSHTFRRTVATLLDDAGVPARAVANHLGQSSIATTQRFYLDRRQPVEQAASVL